MDAPGVRTFPARRHCQVPHVWRDTLVTASGMTPRMNVSGVIRVGRSRMRARRLKNRMPTLPQLLYELDDQD